MTCLTVFKKEKIHQIVKPLSNPVCVWPDSEQSGSFNHPTSLSPFPKNTQAPSLPFMYFLVPCQVDTIIYIRASPGPARP